MSEPLSIVMDLGFNADFKRGIDYYVDNVVGGLAEVDDRNQYLLFSYFLRDHARLEARLPHPQRPNFKRLYRRFSQAAVRLLDIKYGLPVVEKGLLRGQKFSIYHVLAGGLLPHVAKAKTIVTFFDLAVEAFPARGTPDPGRRINDPYTYEYAQRADCLVATGECTKKDLMRYYAVAEEKIEVIPTGVDLKVFHEVSDPAERGRVRARYGLPEKFLMVIGPYVPPRRTNAEVTLRAYAELHRAGLTGGCKLAFVGARNDHLERLLKLAGELGVGSQAIATGYVALEDLAAVYSLSTAVVHPTTIEGFGYGFEVLACGTPFITSNLPGVLESVGGVALTVAPSDEESLRRALLDVISKPELRRELRQKGLTRAALYDYKKIGERFRALYEKLARGGR